MYLIFDVNVLRNTSFPRERHVSHCELQVEMDSGSTILNGDVFLNAAGPWAGFLMETIGVDLPVTPRKRYVFVFDCPKGPGRSMPMLVDPRGVYCRPDGNGTQYLCGASPCEVNT